MAGEPVKHILGYGNVGAFSNRYLNTLSRVPANIMILLEKVGK